MFCQIDLSSGYMTTLFQLTPWSRILEIFPIPQLDTKFPQGLLPLSQEHATSPYSQIDESSPHPHGLFL